MRTENIGSQEEEGHNFHIHRGHLGSESYPNESEAWTPEREEDDEEDDEEAVLETQFGSPNNLLQYGHGDEEQPEDGENDFSHAMDVGSGPSAQEDFYVCEGQHVPHNATVALIDDEEDNRGGNFIDLDGNEEYKVQAGNLGSNMYQSSTHSASDYDNTGYGYGSEYHAQQSVVPNHLRYSTSVEIHHIPIAHPNHLNPNFGQFRPSFTPLGTASFQNPSNKTSQWLQSRRDSPTIDLDNSEGTEGLESNVDTGLDLNAALY